METKEKVKYYKPVERGNPNKAFIDGVWVECDFCSQEEIESKFYELLGIATMYKRSKYKGTEILKGKVYAYKFKEIKL